MTKDPERPSDDLDDERGRANQNEPVSRTNEEDDADDFEEIDEIEDDEDLEA